MVISSDFLQVKRKHEFRPTLGGCRHQALSQKLHHICLPHSRPKQYVAEEQNHPKTPLPG